MLKLLTTILLATATSIARAADDAPYLVSYQDLMTMTEPQRDDYLREVADALRTFEERQADEMIAALESSPHTRFIAHRFWLPFVRDAFAADDVPGLGATSAGSFGLQGVSPTGKPVRVIKIDDNNTRDASAEAGAPAKPAEEAAPKAATKAADAKPSTPAAKGVTVTPSSTPTKLPNPTPATIDAGAGPQKLPNATGGKSNPPVKRKDVTPSATGSIDAAGASPEKTRARGARPQGRALTPRDEAEISKYLGKPKAGDPNPGSVNPDTLPNKGRTKTAEAAQDPAQDKDAPAGKDAKKGKDHPAKHEPKAEKPAPKEPPVAKGSHCPRVKNRKAAREQWRSSHQGCFIAGTISKYPNPGQPGQCRADGAGCGKMNSFGDDGALLGAKDARVTRCQRALYCMDDGKPLCVLGNKTAFANCDVALKNNKNVKFGKACAKGPKYHADYNELKKNVEDICSSDKSGLFCPDCEALRAKLKAAAEKNGVAGAPGAPAAPGLPKPAHEPGENKSAK